MKALFKKNWLLFTIAFLINVPILIFCCTRTNYYLILKGDTTKFTSVVEVETDYTERKAKQKAPRKGGGLLHIRINYETDAKIFYNTKENIII